MNKHIRITFASIFVLALTSSLLSIVNTQAISMDENHKIDNYVEKWRENWNVPSAQIGILEGGKLSYQKTYGKNVPQDDTQYINSMSKSMTAYGLMLLVQNGKLSIDDKVSKYLPGFAISKYDVTIKNLLNHTSGLAEHDGDNVILENTFSSVQQEADAMKNTKVEPSLIGKFQYSNVGYLFLGYIIEKVSGMEYADYMSENVFIPLGMVQTSAEDNKSLIPGYTGFFTSNIPMSIPFSKGNGPYGSIHSTIPDIAKFLSAQTKGFPLHEKYVELMRTEKVPYWDDGKTYQGLGWMLFSGSYKPELIFHEGYGVGYQSSMAIEPSTGFGIIILVNKIYYLDDSMNTWSLSEAIQDIHKGKTPQGIAYNFALSRSLGMLSIVIILALAIFLCPKMKQLKKHTKLKKIISITFIIAGILALPVVLYLNDTTLGLAFLYSKDVMIALVIASIELITLGITLWFTKKQNTKIPKQIRK